jgi:hypothetical protein
MDWDNEKLLGLMRDDFMTCYWRADGSPSAPADALAVIYNHYWNADARLEWVQDADLRLLMGGTDPLSAGLNVRAGRLTPGWETSPSPLPLFPPGEHPRPE